MRRISFTKFLLQKQSFKNISTNVLVAATCCVHAEPVNAASLHQGWGHQGTL